MAGVVTLGYIVNMNEQIIPRILDQFSSYCVMFRLVSLNKTNICYFV